MEQTQQNPTPSAQEPAATAEELAPIVCGFNSNMFAVSMSRAQDIATAWEKIATICKEYREIPPTPEELATPDYIKTLPSRIAAAQVKVYAKGNPYAAQDITERVTAKVKEQTKDLSDLSFSQTDAKYVKIDDSGTASIDEELCMDDCKIRLQGEPAARYRQIQKACAMINEALEQIAPIGNYLESIDKDGHYQVRPSTAIYWPYVLK